MYKFLENKFCFLISLFLCVNLFADVVVFKSGKKLEDVKIKVGRDNALIYFPNDKKEVHKKSVLKSVRLKPVSWNTSQIGSKTSESIKTALALKNKNRKDAIEQEMARLAYQRELNFAISEKVWEERKNHDSLMKERIRLQYTEGLLTYAGEQKIYTEIMTKLNNKYYIRNRFGLLYFSSEDFGDEMVIETDKGKETIDFSKILAVKEEKFIEGYIYLAGGSKFIGKIKNRIADLIIVSTSKGEVRVEAKEIIYPELPKEIPSEIAVKEGETGEFLFGNGQVIKGKLIKYSTNFMSIETIYGTIEMNPKDLVSASKEEIIK